MIFNIVYGKPKYATIVVTYPEGGVCTCSDGTKTLTAEDTSGLASFVVPHSGTWTVQVTKNGLSSEDTVDVNTLGATYTKVLKIRYYLFKSGEGAKVGMDKTTHRSETAAGWGAVAQSTASIGTNSMSLAADIAYYSEADNGYITASANIHTTVNVNFASYTSMVIEGSRSRGDPKVYRGNKNMGSMASSSTRAEKRFDISSISENTTLEIRASVIDKAASAGTIYNWYLEA